MNLIRLRLLARNLYLLRHLSSVFCVYGHNINIIKLNNGISRVVAVLLVSYFSLFIVIEAQAKLQNLTNKSDRGFVSVSEGSTAFCHFKVRS